MNPGGRVRIVDAPSGFGMYLGMEGNIARVLPDSRIEIEFEPRASSCLRSEWTPPPIEIETDRCELVA